MAMELRQQVKMAQTLRMTPQLQHAIKLLQLSRMELIAEVRQEMVENPVLEELHDDYEHTGHADEIRHEQGPKEREKLSEVKADGSDVDQSDWEKYVESYSSSSMPSNSYKGLNTEDYPSLEQTLSTSVSLVEHLMEQLRLSDANPIEEHIGTLIIGNLNEAGLLANITLEELANEAGTDLETAENALKIVQSFDPLGIAARDLQECLRIQARKLHPKDNLLMALIEDHIPNLERKSYSKIAREMGVPIERVTATARVLATLEPRPGREYHLAEPQYITPDIYIYKVGNEYIPVLNEDGMPKLRISNFYRKELARKKATGEKDEVQEYIQDKLRGALWLIRSIHTRQSTIVKVTESIIKFQRDFFDHGVEHLKPLVLRDIADDIERSESTVSRVTTNKYVHTPRGIFELKYFFNSSITNLGGDDLASEAVKAKIREIISKEDEKKPFSDSKIAEMLAADDIDIARRTVAKYRESMGILSSTMRKNSF